MKVGGFSNSDYRECYLCTRGMDKELQSVFFIVVTKKYYLRSVYLTAETKIKRQYKLYSAREVVRIRETYTPVLAQSTRLIRSTARLTDKLQNNNAHHGI